MTTRPTARLDAAALFTAALLFAPPLVFAAAGLEGLAYRCAQGALVVAALATGLGYAWRYGAQISGRAAVIAAILTINLLAQLGSLVIAPRLDFRIEGVQTTLLYLAILIGFDLMARRISFEALMRAAAPLALVVVAASALHVTFVDERLYGRALYFGAHPNLGGEVLLAAVAALAFQRSGWLRLAVYMLAAATMFQLQSRAAMMGLALLIAIVETPANAARLKRLAPALAFAAAATAAVLISSPGLVDRILDHLTHDILRLHDPYRGLNSGLVGRDALFAAALQEAAEAPVFGKGVNQFPVDVPLQLHNGYLRILAEVGYSGLALFAVMAWGCFCAFRVSPARAAGLIAMLIVFYFNARSFSLNIYPLILWLAVLPWAGEPRGVPAMLARAPAPPPAPMRSARQVILSGAPALM